MSSSISEIVENMADRLKLHNWNDSSLEGFYEDEPTMSQLEKFAVLAFKQALAEMPPVHHGQFTVDENLLVEVPDLLQVLYVQSERDILIDTEYTEWNEGIRIYSYQVAKPGESVRVWYTGIVALETDPEQSFDTSCIFGQDWLDEYILEIAVRSAVQHMINISGTSGATQYGSMYRVSQDQTQALHQRLMMDVNRWHESKKEAKNARMAIRPPLRRSPLAGFRNRSSIRNRITE